MQAYDIIMLVVLGVTTLIGFRKGLAWQIASVAAIVVSYVVAVRFRDVVAQRIDTQPPWNTFLAMLILYVATSFVIWAAFQFVRGFIDRAKLKEFDQQLGAIFGLAKGVLLCVIITLFAVTLLGPSMRQQIITSKSGLYIARLLDQADQVMPEELHEFLHPYLHQLDQQKGPYDGAWPERATDPQDDLDRIEDWLENTGRQLGDQGGAGQPSDEMTGSSSSWEDTWRDAEQQAWQEDDPYYRRSDQYRAEEAGRGWLDR